MTQCRSPREVFLALVNGIADGTGEPTVLPAIFVLRVRDGEIVSSRDYHDHITSARARGQLDELFAAIKTQDGAARIDAQT